MGTDISGVGSYSYGATKVADVTWHIYFVESQTSFRHVVGLHADIDWVNTDVFNGVSSDVLLTYSDDGFVSSIRSENSLPSSYPLPALATSTVVTTADAGLSMVPVQISETGSYRYLTYSEYKIYRERYSVDYRNDYVITANDPGLRIDVTRQFPTGDYFSRFYFYDASDSVVQSTPMSMFDQTIIYPDSDVKIVHSSATTGNTTIWDGRAGASFALALSSSTAAIAEPVTATLTTPSGADYSYLSWFIDGSLYSTYYLNGTTWYEYDTFTGTYSHATTETAAKTQPLTFATEGSHTVTCRVYDSTLAELASPSATAVISGTVSPTVTNVTAAGFVYDVTTGTIVEGATVAAAQSAAGFSDSDTTDSAGYFSIAGLKPDFPVSFTTSATNYTSQTIQYTAVPQMTTWPITLYLFPDTAPAGASLYGQVYSSGTAQGIDGATVSITNGSYSDSTTTSSAGFYEFSGLDEGTYTMTATADGHTAISESVSVGSSATQHNVAMVAHYALAVTVKDATTSAIIANTTVTFSLTDGQETTSATGAATFTVDYGTYTVTAAAEGYYPNTAYAYVERDTSVTVLLTAIPEPTTAPDLPNFPPHNVKIVTKTVWGSPITGATITAQGVEETASPDWFEALLGINATNTPIDSEAMTGTTDSNGEIDFMMIESVKYHITAYKADEIDEEMDIYPKDDEYTIYVSSVGAFLPSGNNSISAISVNVTTSKTDSTGHIAVHYNDTTRKTTSLNIQVTQKNATNATAPEDVIDFYNVASDSDVSHTFDIADASGQSYFVRVEATHPDFGTVKRDYAAAFRGVRVPLGDIPDGLYIWIAGGAIILLGCFFGASSATFGAVLCCFAGWVFLAFGWLDDAGLIGPVALSFATVLSIVSVITKRYREEGYT